MKCPFCTEEIQDSAIKCRFCGEVLNQEAFDQARAQLRLHSKAQAKDRTLLLGGLTLIAIGAALVYALYYGYQRTPRNDVLVASPHGSREEGRLDQDALTRTKHTPRSYDQVQNDMSDGQAKLSAAHRANAQVTESTLGDPAMAKPEENPNKEAGQALTPRPRTVKEALARRNLQSLSGEKMKPDGRVRRRLELTSFDAKATPFGAYDAKMVETISQRWYSLLDDPSYNSNKPGKVILKYRLHFDGTITDLEVAENTVNEKLSLLCQKAVIDSAPYAAWSAETRRALGEVRTLQFTFYYD